MEERGVLKVTSKADKRSSKPSPAVNTETTAKENAQIRENKYITIDKIGMSCKPWRFYQHCEVSVVGEG